MPWRLIGIIVVAALLLGFIGLNLENTCDLNLGITEFHDVPVYITIFASFLLGMLFSLPFFLSFMKKKHQKEKSLTGKEGKNKTEDIKDHQTAKNSRTQTADLAE
jgi:uncharacterized integral membrane protein